MKNYESRLLEANNEARYLSEYCNHLNLNQMNGYHSFNNWSFKKANDNDENCFIGVELETTNDRSKNDYKYEEEINDIVRDTRYLSDYQFVAERDSSIGNGIEFISHASTIEYWYSIKDKITDAFEYLTDKGMISDEANKLDINCGLHFHVSKDYLGSTQQEIDNTIDFIWLLLENFKNPLQKLARRSSNHYTQFLSDYLGRNTAIKEKYKSFDFIKKSNSKTDTRYFALNITNDKTIEFRFIKGTLNVDTFYSSIELIKNIVDLAKNCSGDLNKLVGKKMKDLINYNNSKFLPTYAQTRNIDLNIEIIDTSNQLETLIALQVKRQAREINKRLESYNSIMLNNASCRLLRDHVGHVLGLLLNVSGYRQFLTRFIDTETSTKLYNLVPYLPSRLNTKELIMDYYNNNYVSLIETIKKIDLRELKRHLVQEIVKYYVLNDKNISDSEIEDKYKYIMDNITEIKNWSIR